MTRQEFDRRFAATTDNTEGFSVAQLARLNDLAFEQVRGHDDDDPLLKSRVGHALEQAARSFDVAAAG